MSEHSYHKLYDRLVDEVKTLYYANQVRIHKGLWALIISTVLFLTIMFITNGSKVIFLLMWIATMFAVAAYLIAVEYLNFELKRKVEEITRREQDFGEETADIVVRQRRQLSCRDDKRAGSRDGGRPHRYDTAQDGCRPQR